MEMVFNESGNNVAYYKGYKYNSIQRLHQIGIMHGVKRVIIFCTMTAILPTILIITPLYLRHNVFADVSYPVAESDVVAITDGISSIFCQAHSLRMNTTFNAFQLRKHPELSTKRKHLRLKKSMTLADDTLEYWGFYLLKGASVLLKVCSRYEGSRILVVRGEKNLKTCGLLEHNLRKVGSHLLDEEHKQVKVTFEHAQEIHDAENEDNAAENLDDFDDHPKRHMKKRKLHEDVTLQGAIKKRDVTQLLDGGTQHGGNAINHTDRISNSLSSFESDLLTCYDGSILLTQGFNPSHLCTNVHYLDKGEHMETVHEVATDGYYYYIFYSDNDFITNDMHAVFDIYKPTYQYVNNSRDKECVNVTQCDFNLGFFSDETVIVEVPTHDGLEIEEDNIALLISTCHPRMKVYMIFPIAVLFLILGCAFI